MSENFISVNSNFVFNKYRMAYLTLSLSRSNIFLTLSDLRFNPIITKSAGLLDIRSKRRKLTTQTVDFLVDSFLDLFKAYNILGFHLRLTTRVTKYIWALVLRLKFNSFFIYGISVRKRIAHSSGMRVRKPRRV